MTHSDLVEFELLEQQMNYGNAPGKKRKSPPGKARLGVIKETVKEYQWKNLVERVATLESSLHTSNTNSVAEQGS